MLNYLLFAGDEYYPVGGVEDFIGDYRTEAKAIKAFHKLKGEYDWFQVMNIEDRTYLVAQKDEDEWEYTQCEL